MWFRGRQHSSIHAASPWSDYALESVCSEIFHHSVRGGQDHTTVPMKPTQISIGQSRRYAIYGFHEVREARVVAGIVTPTQPVTGYPAPQANGSFGGYVDVVWLFFLDESTNSPGP